MKMPKYMTVTTKYKGNQLYAIIKMKRWGWGWLVITHIKPTSWRGLPAWCVFVVWITFKGLVGKMG